MFGSGYVGNIVINFGNLNCSTNIFMCGFVGFIYWIILFLFIITINGSILPIHLLIDDKKISFIISVFMFPIYIFGPGFISTFGPNNYCTLKSYYDFMNIKCVLLGDLVFLTLSFFWLLVYGITLLFNKFTNNKTYYVLISLFLFIGLSPIIGYFSNIILRFHNDTLNCIQNPLYCGLLGMIYIPWGMLTVLSINMFIVPIHLYCNNAKISYIILLSLIPTYFIVPQLVSLLISKILPIDCNINSYYGLMNWICMLTGCSTLLIIGSVLFLIYGLIVLIQKLEKFINN